MTNADHLAARREQVIRVAVTLFAEQGIAATTMADVVAASGLSADAVHQCFPGQADLMLAVVSRYAGPADEEVAGETQAEMIGRLAGYLSSADGCTHARLLAQIWGEAAVTPEIAAIVRASHQHAEARLASGEPVVTAQVALAALIGLAALVAADIPVETKAFRQTVTRLFDGPL